MLMVILCVFAVISGFYFLLECHYFLRLFISFISAKICKKNVHILGETVTKGLCITTDIDSLLNHMNNARYVRELDFARTDFLQRTALYNTIRSHGGKIVIGATTIRYRRFIKLFTRYSITSKIIFWDEQNFYMEHRFVSPSDNFINAIVLCRIRVTDVKSVEDIFNELLLGSNDADKVEKEAKKPEMPEELMKWIEYNEISSKLLRSDNKK